MKIEFVKPNGKNEYDPIMFAQCELETGMAVEAEIRKKKNGGDLMVTVRSRKTGEIHESGYDVYHPVWKFSDGKKNKEFKDTVLTEFLAKFPELKSAPKAAPASSTPF